MKKLLLASSFAVVSCGLLHGSDIDSGATSVPASREKNSTSFVRKVCSNSVVQMMAATALVGLYRDGSIESPRTYKGKVDMMIGVGAWATVTGADDMCKHGFSRKNVAKTGVGVLAVTFGLAQK